eukprot:607841-Rhodomonas_salina.1
MRSRRSAPPLVPAPLQIIQRRYRISQNRCETFVSAVTKRLGKSIAKVFREPCKIKSASRKKKRCKVQVRAHVIAHVSEERCTGGEGGTDGAGSVPGVELRVGAAPDGHGEVVLLVQRCCPRQPDTPASARVSERKEDEGRRTGESKRAREKERKREKRERRR